MPQTSGNIIADAVRADTVRLHERFAMSKPFHHIVIDDFFGEEFARELVAQFPPFEGRYAINELGKVGGKAVVTALPDLGPAYRQAHEYFSSPAFLEWIGAVTGIAGLQYDGENFGGGTHENLHGQRLEAHVDFNYHPTTHYHRRLNMIVYLNEGWKAEWGGNITVHSNPRDPANDQKKAYAPIFNRCIVFETNERSWHSFDPIDLPADERGRSRKSLSIYLYTRERPDAETFSKHTTFYVPRPLPPEFQAGKTLTAEDVDSLQALLTDRDELIALHQHREAEREPATVEANRALALINQMRSNALLPFMGYVLQRAPTSGWYGDGAGWAADALEFTVEPVVAVEGFTIRGRIHERMPADASISVEAGGKTLYEGSATPGQIVIPCKLRIEAGERVRIRIATTATANLKALGVSEDARDLALLVETIVFDHLPQ